MLHAFLDAKKFRESLTLAFALPGILDHNILLTAKEEALFLELASGGVYLKYKLPAEVTGDGFVCLDGDRIHTLALSGKVELEQLSAGKMRCKAGRLNAVLDLNQDNQVENNKPYRDIECPTAIMRDMLLASLERTDLVPAIPSATHGVRFSLSDSLTGTCTDGFRGTLFKREASSDVAIDVMVKPQALVSVLKSTTASTVYVGQSHGMVKITTGDVELFYPSIQTEMDDVEGMFTSTDVADAKVNVQVKRKDFEASIKEAVSVVGAATVDTRLTMSFTGESIVLYVKASTGEATSTYDCTYDLEQRCGVVVSPKYILELLSLVKEDMVTMHVFDEMILLSTEDGTYKSALPTVVAS